MRLNPYQSYFLYLFTFWGLTTTFCKTSVNPALSDPHFITNLTNKRIRLVAPASGIRPQSLDKLLQLQEIKLEKTSPSYQDLPYHSNSDVDRFVELKEALSSENMDVIWALRGGYGSARIFDALQALEKPTQRKIFIGYSDMTFLHLFFQKWGFKTIHGAMASELLNPNKDPKNFLLLGDILAGKTKQLSYSGLTPLNQPAATSQNLKGQIIGGNLTLLANSLGTAWALHAENKILFIEDVHVKGYAIDRDLLHLKQAGALKGVIAILFGTFTDGDEYVDYALQRFAQEIQIPVFQAPLFGHGKVNYPLVFGCQATIFQKSLTEEKETQPLQNYLLELTLDGF